MTVPEGFDNVEGWPNLNAPELIPYKFRVRHWEMMRTFDRKFKPIFTDILPMTEAPDGGAQRFEWPIYTAARPMARLYDAEEPTRYLGAPSVKTETFMSRITKAGFIRRFDEFKRDFSHNLISLKYQIMAESMVEAVAKRIEFEIGNILYQNTRATLNYTTNQDMSRALVADVAGGKFYKSDKTTEITELAGLMSGAQWQNNASDIFRDFAAIKRAKEDMTDREVTKAFFGPETVMWLDINSTVIDRLKYIKDTTDGVLGTTIQGVTIKKVMGNNLKESPENQAAAIAGTGRFGYPGLGDLDYDKWGERNKVPLMVDGGTTGREWGLMTEDIIGRTFNSYIHTLHQDQAGSAIQPFVYQFSEQEPFRVKIRMERMFAPVIEDYASYVLILNTVDRSNR